MALSIDAGKWRDRRGMERLLDALGAEEGLTRYVGGAVRDDLLDLPVSDVDLATRLEPQDVVQRLEAARIKAVPTGIDHGTVTAVSDGHPYEVTTLRRDVTTDGRRATVAFTSDWEEDAARRDFTINALSADPRTGQVYDYFGGLEDLLERHVRFIGDPLKRICRTRASWRTEFSELPKTISGSSATSASTRGSAPASPTGLRSRRASRAPTT